jgi:hypothetical protein
MKTVPFRSNPLKATFAGLLGAAAIISAPGQAQAANPIVVVTPPSQAGTYTIEYITGTYATVVPRLLTTPWWGSSSLAGQLATALAATKVPCAPGTPVPGPGICGDLTLPPINGQSVNTLTGAQNLGYLFASGTSTLNIPGFPLIPLVDWSSTIAPAYLTGLNGSTTQADPTSYSWAVGTFVPAPPSTVPGPLPLVGAAAAFGFSRRLRSRINKSATA